MDVGGQPTLNGNNTLHQKVVIFVLETILSMVVGILIGMGITVVALVVASSLEEEKEKKK